LKAVCRTGRAVDTRVASGRAAIRHLKLPKDDRASSARMLPAYRQAASRSDHEKHRVQVPP